MSRRDILMDTDYDIIATQERKNTNDNKRGSFGIRSVVS